MTRCSRNRASSRSACTRGSGSHTSGTRSRRATSPSTQQSIRSVSNEGGSPTSALLAEYHRSGARDYATWEVGDNLGGAVFLLGFVLVAGTAAGT
ncbi:MAG TPA: hypothetical protein VE570_10230, partial [Thermoleophilaceae bacterium]|nr:hypothetical protein [Thermoleophilaceae bacterium]